MLDYPDSLETLFGFQLMVVEILLPTASLAALDMFVTQNAHEH